MFLYKQEGANTSAIVELAVQGLDRQSIHMTHSNPGLLLLLLFLQGLLLLQPLLIEGFQSIFFEVSHSRHMPCVAHTYKESIRVAEIRTRLLFARTFTRNSKWAHRVLSSTFKLDQDQQKKKRREVITDLVMEWVSRRDTKPA